MIGATNGEVRCRVRGGTEAPCPRPATLEIEGVHFCEPCAREQEAYFAIGELTERPRSPQDDERLVKLLARMRRTARRRTLRADQTDVVRALARAS